MASTLPDIVGISMPFAANGSRSNLPDQQTTPGDGSASLSTGFPPETQLPLDNGGVPPGRADMNAMAYLATLPLFRLQQGGYYTFSSDVASKIGGYPQGAVLYYLDNSTNPAKYKFLMSAVANNMDNFITTPSFIGTSWIDVTPYADGFVPLAGGTMTGDLAFSGTSTGLDFPNGGKIRNSGSDNNQLTMFLQDSNFNNVLTIAETFVRLASGGKQFQINSNGAATWQGNSILTVTDSYRSGYNWYYVFNNGLIIQGGRFTANNTNAVINISLNKEFTTTSYFPAFTDDGVDGAQITAFKFLPSTSTAAVMSVRRSDTATGDTFRWFAIGI